MRNTGRVAVQSRDTQGDPRSKSRTMAPVFSGAEPFSGPGGLPGTGSATLVDLCSARGRDSGSGSSRWPLRVSPIHYPPEWLNANRVDFRDDHRPACPHLFRPRLHQSDRGRADYPCAG